MQFALDPWEKGSCRKRAHVAIALNAESINAGEINFAHQGGTDCDPWAEHETAWHGLARIPNKLASNHKKS
jgi:hypothetical protein